MFDERKEQELIQSINKQIELELEQPTFSERLADTIALFSGGWFFLIFLVCFLACWICINVLMPNDTFDPYPFILLNLFLSFLSIFQNVIIAMTQNRISSINRKREEREYMLTIKTELELKELHKKIDSIINSK